VTSPPPNILIVLDRSASMNDTFDGMTCPGTYGCGVTSKWSLMTTAMEQVLPLEETKVNWGLKFFAEGGGLSTDACVVLSGVEIAPQVASAAMIAFRLEATHASGSTPTTAAISAAATYLSSLNDGAPKFILLVTDGIPTCGVAPCAGAAPGSLNQCDDANAIAAVKSAYDTLGISTFVVGVGMDVGSGDATLAAMAIAGGQPRSANPSYYPVESGADLIAAFTTIAGLAAP
jgi:hypothetical protein